MTGPPMTGRLQQMSTMTGQPMTGHPQQMYYLIVCRMYKRTGPTWTGLLILIYVVVRPVDHNVRDIDQLTLRNIHVVLLQYDEQ